MNQSFDATGAQWAWDATSISLAQTCLRKYKYKMIEGWSPRNQSAHLRFGSAYASALEHYYKYRALGADSEEALRKVVFEALIETWDYPTCETCKGHGIIDQSLGGASQSVATSCPDCLGKGTAGEGKPWESDHNLKTRENLIRTIIWYVAQFEDEAITVWHTPEGKPAVEYSYTLNVEDGIAFCGHIDRLVEYADAIWVMDQKTTGSAITKKYMDGFKPNTQMSMYSFAGKAVYSAPIKGVIIDAAQVAVGFSRFERGFTTRTETELNEWYDDAMYWIAQARAAAIEQHFPMNPASCGNYGGCEFRHVCSRSPEVRPRFLAADFEQGPSWDPLERR